YYICFVDDYTDYKEVVFLKTRDEATKAVIIFHMYWSQRFNLPLRYLRTDGEFIAKDLIDYCRASGIARELTTPRTPQHNSKAERANRSLIERARCFIYQSGVPAGYFPEVILHACRVGNLIPRSDGVIPSLRWELPQHRLGSFPTFGCEVFGMTNTFGGKLASRSIRSVFLGVYPERKAYKLLAMDDRKCFWSRDVKVNESAFPFKKEGVPLQRVMGDSILEPSPDHPDSPPRTPPESGGEHFLDPPERKHQVVESIPGSSPPAAPDELPLGDRPDDPDAPSSHSRSPEPSSAPLSIPEDDLPSVDPSDVKHAPPSPHDSLRRSTRVSRPPDRGPMITYEAMVDFLAVEKKDEFAQFACCSFSHIDSPS
ncbi:MAG: DDE-type integrase/transposase/recombinase, partial [Deltaproteobacteria bacterium]|nr:DDE-type integrase/transposase/recombinase [Deltaproteobacteria bacterium]